MELTENDNDLITLNNLVLDSNKVVLLSSKKQKYKQEYYKNNQELFKKMVKCDVCNCNIQKYTLNRHNNLKKHLENLAKKAELDFIKEENERLMKLLSEEFKN